MATDKLGKAVQLIRAGNRQTALPILKEIVQDEPSNEMAWLWLYSCVDTPQQKRFCLQKSLEINPNNQKTREVLDKLTAPAAPAPVPVSKPAAQLAQNRSQSARPVTNPVKLAVSTGQAPKAKTASNRTLLIAGGVALFLLFCVGSGVVGGNLLYTRFTGSGSNRADPGNTQNDPTSVGNTGNRGTEPGNGVDPFKDTENTYDDNTGVSVLNYGSLIDMLPNEGFPSPNSPVIKFKDIVFILYGYGLNTNENIYFGQYADGQFSQRIPIKVKPQGSGDALRVEMRNLKDGVYCFAADDPAINPKQDFWCIQVGDKVTIAQTKALVQPEQMKAVLMSYFKSPNPEKPEWSLVRILYAIENRSDKTITILDNEKIKTQQGFEYKCRLNYSLLPPNELPSGFRTLQALECEVPTDSSGYSLLGDWNLFTQPRAGTYSYSATNNIDELKTKWSWILELGSGNTNLSFPMINPNNYSQPQTRYYRADQSIDLTDIRLSLSHTTQNDGNAALLKVDNTFAGGDVQVAVSGTWFFPSGLGIACGGYNFSIPLGGSQSEYICGAPINIYGKEKIQDGLGYTFKENRAAGSCLFISQVSITYGQVKKAPITIPEFLLVCFP